MVSNRMRMVPAATTSFAVQVGGGAISALTNLYLAGALGPTSKGAAQVLVTVPAILVVVSNLGVHIAGAWFIGTGRYRLAQVLSAVLWWAIIVSLLLAIPLWLFFEQIRLVIFGGVEAQIVAVSLACVPFYILAYYAADILLASGRLILYAILRLLPLVTYGLAAVLLVGIRGMGLFGATVAFASGIILSGLFALGLVIALSHGRLSPQREVMRQALGFGGYVHLGTVAQFLTFRIDVLIVNALAGRAAAGFYAVASSLAEIVWYAGRAVESVIVPRIARASGDEARQISSTAIRVTGGMSILTAAAIAVGAPLLVHRLLPAFVPALPAVWVLLPGTVLSGMFIVAAGDLRGRGRPALAAAISVTGLILNVMLNFILIPRFGFIGAAAASLLTYACQAVAAAYALSRISGATYRSMVALSLGDLKLFRAITQQPW
jgi:O-antigen/teichoic acid export membrane protein